MAVGKIQKHIFLSGRVQGVGFRAFTRQQAAVLNINGWVKNLADGRVEIVVQGERTKVKEMISKLKEGPSFAKVEDIEINEEKLDDLGDFKIKY